MAKESQSRGSISRKCYNPVSVLCLSIDERLEDPLSQLALLWAGCQQGQYPKKIVIWQMRVDERVILEDQLEQFMRAARTGPGLKCFELNAEISIGFVGDDCNRVMSKHPGRKFGFFGYVHPPSFGTYAPAPCRPQRDHSRR